MKRRKFLKKIAGIVTVAICGQYEVVPHKITAAELEVAIITTTHLKIRTIMKEG